MLKEIELLLIGHELDFGFGLSGALICLVLFIAAIVEYRNRKTKDSKTFAHMVFSCLMMFISNTPLLFSNGNVKLMFVTNISLIASFIFGVAVIFFFSMYLIDDLKEKAFVSDGTIPFIGLLCGLIVIIAIVGSFQKPSWIYNFDENGYSTPTDLYYVLICLQLLIMFFDLFLVISCKKSLTKRVFTLWLLFILFPSAVCLLFLNERESIYTFTMALSLLMLYVNIHVHSLTDMALKEKELSESKAKLLVSQIQPHFLYNALNSIYYLIGKDQEKAKEAVSLFSDYLRANVNSLKNDSPISCKEELNHVNAYLALEKIRFGDKIKIIFEENENNFKIPSLTIQPLVENAIKHGLSKKRDGGTIMILTYSDDENYYVEIKDNGIGFEAGKFKDDEKSTHIGLFNVNSRLKSMVGGNLKVVSELKKGTTCLITLPKATQPR